jgi:hypothetical protein
MPVSTMAHSFVIETVERFLPWLYGKLYRRFESTSLRHAVWIAEKPGCLPLRIAENRRNSAIVFLKPDRRKCPA